MYDLTSQEKEKPEHPKKNANLLSLITFWYTVPIFRIGKRRDFDEKDVTKPLDAHKSSTLGEKVAKLWSYEVRRASMEQDYVPGLAKVLFKMFWKEIVVQGTILFMIQVPIRLCQPFFLGLLVRYFSPENQNSTEPVRDPIHLMRIVYYWDKQGPIQLDEAYVFASGVFLCSLVNVVIIHPCMMEVMHLGMKLRIACCSLLYRKTLRLDLASLSGTAIGTVINLMSNDVNRFDTMVIHIHYIWISPIQMFICVILMYKEVGLAAVIGICTILAVIPLQAWFGGRTQKFRLKTASRTDERVRQMNEIIQGMQVIKMYTWEHAFAKQIHNLRNLEMKVIRNACFIRGVNMSFIMFTSRLAVFATILAIVFRNETITVEKVFVVVSFYQILRQTMTLFFPNAIAQIAEANVAILRIKRFLTLTECAKGDHTILDPEWSPSPSQKLDLMKEPEITIRNVHAKIGSEVCLENVSLHIKNKTLTAVIGQVGAGKSSLLNLIMGEMECVVGSCRVHGFISYASQEPWLFAGSVRQNILFGSEFDQTRYLEVVRVCALVKDFKLLPYGDRSLIGEKGVSLSGGQRARVNLARAVYKKADIYLLDDPLSAVDPNVAKHLFDECICEFLSEKMVILVTHQVQFLSDVTKVVLMDNKKILAEGSHEFLETTQLEFAEYLRHQLAADTSDIETTPSSGKIDTVLKGLKIQSQLSLGVIDKEGERYKPRAEADIRTLGSVDWNNYKQYFRAGGNCCVIFCVFSSFLGAEILASGGDYFVAAWIDLEERRETNFTTTDHFLASLSTQLCTIIYSIIILSTMVVALSRAFVFFIVCVRASINLHNQMFNSIITAPMRFFGEHSSGRILNRFAKDLGAVDELLPIAMLDCFQIILNLLGAVCLVIAANYYLVLPTVIICFVFFSMRSFYLKTSRSTKRLEGINRSPVFAHLNASIQGLPTVRSSGAEKILVQEFDRLQDDHSGAWFMYISTTRAFGYWLDVICVLYVGLICYSFLISSANGSSVGLAVTATIGLTGLFQWGMKQSAEVENQMTSVERVLEYTRIEHEPDLKSKLDKKPPPEWPTEGKIEFKNLVLRYKPHGPPVLKSLNFLINPQEKIGIVGRTGAGKSSLISALFRLAPFEGLVLIDEIDTTQIGLHDLRGRISIIPQEPVLFSGTLRYNMDPFSDFDDDSVLQALNVVENKSGLPGGFESLDYHVAEGGTNLSVGERQVICLARAVLRNNRILVLDEATANIDPQTDTFIQTAIREHFAQCTVLTIAHRLNTIMDSDRVLVVDAGEVVEFDHPHLLLKNRVGVFSLMVKKTGKAMANNLMEIAKDNYERKRKLK